LQAQILKMIPVPDSAIRNPHSKGVNDEHTLAGSALQRADADVRTPAFTAMAVLTLALGVGATTAIFSVVYATLFESLPYPKPEQLVMVWSQVNQGRNSVSAGDYLEWKQRSTSFQYLEAWAAAPSM
jgi:hypothetical protein